MPGGSEAGYRRWQAFKSTGLSAYSRYSTLRVAGCLPTGRGVLCFACTFSALSAPCDCTPA
jgi:hypothetical protein